MSTPIVGGDDVVDSGGTGYSHGSGNCCDAMMDVKTGTVLDMMISVVVQMVLLLSVVLLAVEEGVV